MIAFKIAACGPHGISEGTGWFVNSNSIVTAAHVVCCKNKNQWVWQHSAFDGVKYRVIVNGEQVALAPGPLSANSDLAILTVASDALSFSDHVMPVAAKAASCEDRWSSTGFPGFMNGDSIFTSGKVIGHSAEKKLDQLHVEQGTNVKWNGYSGSPIFVDGGVVGVVTDSVTQCNTFFSADQASLIQFLDQAGVTAKAIPILQTGAIAYLALPGKLKMPFIFVKGGEFWIGATPRDRDALKYERPRHRIRLNDFWLGKFPVTQEEWLSVVEENCFEFPGEKRRPAECVQWIDIYSKFIQKLGGGLRFPTEAEWEIAARGGLDSKSRYGPLKEIAWYEENSQEKTHPVGLKKPNPFGFYDMIGNVWEFCQDKWDKAAYDTRQGISGNPCNQDLTKRNVVGRGGSYLESPEYLRASARDKFEPNAQYCTAGFRLACSIRPKDE